MTLLTSLLSSWGLGIGNDVKRRGLILPDVKFGVVVHGGGMLYSSEMLELRKTGWSGVYRPW